MSADGIDIPPPSADSRLPGTDSARGRPQVDLHLDEATPETDAAASSPGKPIAADSTPTRDEGHALAADPPYEPRDHRHAANSGASRLRVTALVIGEIGSVLSGAGVPDSISTVRGHADQPTISQGIGEERKMDLGNGFQVHQVSDTATVEPAPPKGKEQPHGPPEKGLSLPERHKDQFPRAQNSPKRSDQVPDKRLRPTGRGQSRGGPK
jgi:hypothetical protein